MAWMGQELDAALRQAAAAAGGWEDGAAVEEEEEDDEVSVCRPPPVRWLSRLPGLRCGKQPTPAGFWAFYSFHFRLAFVPFLP